MTEDEAALRQLMRLRGFSLMKNVLDEYDQDFEIQVMVREFQAFSKDSNLSSFRSWNVSPLGHLCTEIKLKILGLKNLSNYSHHQNKRA